MAVFAPAPEEAEPWGRVLYDSVTGADGNDAMIVEAGEGVCV